MALNLGADVTDDTRWHRTKAVGSGPQAATHALLLPSEQGWSPGLRRPEPAEEERLPRAPGAAVPSFPGSLPHGTATIHQHLRESGTVLGALRRLFLVLTGITFTAFFI